MAYHARRVAPLTMHVLPLYVMVPKASFDRTVLTEGMLPNSKIAQCIKEAMDLCGTMRVPPLTLSTRCQGILQCGQS